MKLISWFLAFIIDMLLKDIGEEKEDEGKEESKEEKDVDTQVKEDEGKEEKRRMWTPM